VAWYRWHSVQSLRSGCDKKLVLALQKRSCNGRFNLKVVVGRREVDGDTLDSLGGGRWKVHAEVA
jgi:hypothetical protein